MNHLIEELSRKTIDLDESVSSPPLVTIITAVLNDVSGIESTIQSVIRQSYDRFEYVVIDGASTDGTIAVIEAYADSINYWVSEPDEGIYCAFNKGLEVAQGEWIVFMNSSDCFSSHDILDRVFRFNSLDGFAVVYGNHNVIASQAPLSLRSCRGGAVKNLWRGSQFCHQASFTRANVLRIKPFKSHLRVCSDFDFFYSIWKSGAKFCYLDITICDISPGGISDTRRLTSVLEMWSIVERSPQADIYFIVKLARIFLSSAILYIFPCFFVVWLKKLLRPTTCVKNHR